MAHHRFAWASSFAIVTSLALPAAADEPRVGSVPVPGSSGRLLAAITAVLSRPPPSPAPRMLDWAPPPAGLPRMTIATLYKLTF
jgi:hypothetical protein